MHLMFWMPGKVIIVHSEGNDASRRVIEKAGFDFEYTFITKMFCLMDL